MKKISFYLAAVLIATSAFTEFHSGKPKLPKEYAYIPGGTFWYGDEETGKRISLWNFYMSENEVTNISYREFLSEVSSGLSKDELEKIKIDSSCWKLPPFNIHASRPDYGTLAYFNYYPVVNISHDGAVAYCQWLQRKIQKENPKLNIIVRLPTKMEWIYAAKGTNSGDVLYPWSGGKYMRDKNGKFLCNFNFVDEVSVYRNKETGMPEVNKNALSKFRSWTLNCANCYYPNGFGLFNMSGNAAEMIDTAGVCMGGSWMDFGGDVTVISEARYEKANPTLGFRPVIIMTDITKKPE